MIFTSAFIVLFCVMAVKATRRKMPVDWLDYFLGVVFMGAGLTMAGCVIVACVRAMP